MSLSVWRQRADDLPGRLGGAWTSRVAGAAPGAFEAAAKQRPDAEQFCSSALQVRGGQHRVGNACEEFYLS